MVSQGLKNLFRLGLFGSMEEESMDTEGQLHPQNLPTFLILITILVSEPPSLFPGLPSCSSVVVLSAPTFVPVEPVLCTKSQESFGKLERVPLVFSGTPFSPDGKLNALPRPKDSARLTLTAHTPSPSLT